MALEDKNPMQGVSGPGQFAKRTDLQTQSDYYGQGVELDALKKGAPLAKSPDVRGATNTAVRQAAAQAAPTSLYAPTQRPEEPITTGIAMGPGAGPEVLGLNNYQPQSLSQTLASMLPYDTNGEIAALYEHAVARGL
jgi:hypothetical protein